MISRKRDKRAKRITSGLCSRSCYTWVPNFSPLTLSYIVKQREWSMANIKVHSKFIRVCAGVNMGVHGSAADYWLLTKGCCLCPEDVLSHVRIIPNLLGH